MKIAIDIRDACGEKTGKGWYTYHLVRALLKEDKKNTYLLYTNKAITDFDAYKNAELSVIKMKGVRWHLAVLKNSIQRKVNIFVAPTSYIIPAFAPKNLQTCIIIHDLIALLFPKNHNKKAVLIEKITVGRALKKASLIVAVSTNTKNDIVAKFSLNSSKVDVVYPSVGDIFVPLEEKLNVWKQERNLPEKFFLCVGTLEPRKNLEKTLEAHALLIDDSKEKNENPHLVIIGARGWQFKKIFAKLHKLGTAEYVIFKGYASNEELVKYYNTALALVFPSLYEGFGLPPLEAMKCACPVITSALGSLPEVVGDAALLVNPHAAEDLAKAMKKLYDNEEFRLELALSGLQQAEKFDWQKSAKQILNLIENAGSQN